MIPNKVASDCLVCAFCVILSVGMLSGSCALSFKCPHSRNRFATPKFFKCKILLIFSWVVVLPIIVHIGIYVRELFFLSIKDEWKIISRLAAITLNIGSIGFAIPAIIKYNEKLTELNGLSSIIENRKFYGFRTFLNKEMARGFIIKCYLIVIVFVILNIWMLADLIVSKSTLEPDTVSFLQLAITLFVNNYIQYFGSFQLMLTNHLYKLLFRRCFVQIESLLRKKNPELHKYNEGFLIKEIIDVLPEKMPLEENIKRLTYLYISLVRNYRQLSKFVFPSVLIWWLVTVMLYIINLYVVVLLYCNNNVGNNRVDIRVCGSIIGIIIFLHLGQEVIDVVSSKI